MRHGGHGDHGLSLVLASFTGAIVVPSPCLNTHVGDPAGHDDGCRRAGGLGSLKGSFIGAYILGFAEALVVFLLPWALI